jgi:hypothetical protein
VPDVGPMTEVKIVCDFAIGRPRKKQLKKETNNT